MSFLYQDHLHPKDNCQHPHQFPIANHCPTGSSNYRTGHPKSQGGIPISHHSSSASPSPASARLTDLGPTSS